MRPRLVALVAGTGTEVGKTWVGARVAERVTHGGSTVAARKPVQSFAPGHGDTDAQVLAMATGEHPDQVCPPERSYPVPLAPPMAAQVLGLPVPVTAELARWLSDSWPDPAVDVGLVEGAGGVASPVAADGDNADLARAIGADLAVLIADPGLGVINLVRLSVAHLSGFSVVVHLNRFDAVSELHRRNREWLSQRHGFVVTTAVEQLAGHLLT